MNEIMDADHLAECLVLGTQNVMGINLRKRCIETGWFDAPETPWVPEPGSVLRGPCWTHNCALLVILTYAKPPVCIALILGYSGYPQGLRSN